ncbi:MAG: metallophosphoesterase [Cyanobacteria bacterium P01_E01_bin.6]
MTLSFRFAIASDLHIALPHTVPQHTTRFHRTELSIPIFEQVLEQFAQLDLDFLLIPGDLTQDGEPENHEWLSQRLSDLPYPVYVVPGNHDVLEREGGDRSIAADMFPTYYSQCGYGYRNGASKSLYYACSPISDVTLIGLNSIFFDDEGQQLHTGRLDKEQLIWLEGVLQNHSGQMVMVMVHHNVVEHLPGQSRSALGRRYMLENAPALIALLQQYGVRLVFTGHLHVQDVASVAANSTINVSSSVRQELSTGDRLYDITTGSLVTYPHPFRILEYQQTDTHQATLCFETKRISSAPGWDDLQALSREFMAEQSSRFMMRLLTDPPLSMSECEAIELLPHLRYFWPDITNGDAAFHFPQFPQAAQLFFERFSAPQAIDNSATLVI